MHMIAFAIIMGCNPIYIAGMDLDYSQGYAGGVGAPRNDDWQKMNYNQTNDMKILNDSAQNVGTKIINLNKNSWFDCFEIGELI